MLLEAKRLLDLLRRRFLFVLLSLTYFYFYPGGDPNQASRYLLTEAIVLRHAPDITPTHARTIDKGELAGKFYSDKAPGTSLLAVPAYATLRAAEKLTGLDPNERTVARARVHAIAFFVAGLPAVFTALLFARALRRLGSSARAADWLAITLGLGTNVFPYATVIYGHTLAALLLFAIFLLVLEWDLDRSGTNDSPALPAARAIGMGALAGSAFVVEYPTALPVAIMLGFALWRTPRVAMMPTLGRLAVGGVGPIVLHAAFAWWAFGSPLALPYKFVVEPLFRAHTTSGLFGVGLPIPDALYGAFLSPYRGLFFYCPVTALVFAGYAAWIAHGRALRFAALCAAVTVAGVAFVSSYYAWDGGFSTGSRHLVPFCAFFMLPVGVLLQRSMRWKVVGALAAFSSVLIMGVIVAVAIHLPEGDPYRANPLYAYTLPAFLRGELGMHINDVLELGTRKDGGYNIGTLFGLSPRVSLVPPLLAWVAAAAYALVGRREVDLLTSPKEAS